MRQSWQRRNEKRTEEKIEHDEVREATMMHLIISSIRGYAPID
jgi:hypothetical protein